MLYYLYPQLGNCIMLHIIFVSISVTLFSFSLYSFWVLPYLLALGIFRERKQTDFQRNKLLPHCSYCTYCLCFIDLALLIWCSLIRVTVLDCVTFAITISYIMLVPDHNIIRLRWHCGISIKRNHLSCREKKEAWLPPSWTVKLINNFSQA